MKEEKRGKDEADIDDDGDGDGDGDGDDDRKRRGGFESGHSLVVPRRCRK